MSPRLPKFITQVRKYQGFDLFAGIALNRGIGGINPAAVEQALKQNAKIVWMPTIDAENHVRIFGEAGAFGDIGSGSYSNKSSRKLFEPYKVINGKGLSADAKSVIDLIVDFDAILATGHLSEKEIFTVVDYAVGKRHKKNYSYASRDAMP